MDKVINSNRSAKYLKLLAVLALFAFILTTRIFWVVNTQPLSSYNSIEEQFFDLIAARNFADFGFWKTLCLPDYVSSRFLEDHPVVYTHMPPFEALIPAIFARLNLGVLWVRIFYVLINALGLFYVYLFFSKLFRWAIGFTVVFFLANNFNNAFVNADHFSHGLAVFLIFSASLHFLCLNRELKNKHGPLHYMAIFFSALFASLVSYYVSIVQLTFLIFLYFFNYSKPPKKVFLLTSMAFVLGAAMHLLQNIFFLGWNVFLQDMVLTMQNRVFGSPTTQEIVPFFARNNIVCWGAATFSREGFFNTIMSMLRNQFSFLFQNKTIGILFLINFSINIIIFFRLKKLELIKKFAKTVTTLIISALSFTFFLPALAQGYPMDLLFGTTQAFCLGSLVLPLLMKEKSKLFLISAVIFLFITGVFSNQNLKEFFYALRSERKGSSYAKFEKLKKYSEEIIWTNLTYSYVSYFVNKAVAGRCTPDAVKSMELNLCDNVLINSRSPNRTILEKPTIFIFSKNNLSGNMACGSSVCLDDFENYLLAHYELIERIDDLYIFKILPKQ